MPLTGRLGTTVSLPLSEPSIFVLGRTLGIWQYYNAAHDHNRRGFLVEWPITRNH